MFRTTIVLLAMLLAAPTWGALLLYEPFDYTVGDRLGGSGTSPVGQVAPNGQTWITRSPAGGGSYNPANDTLITSGNLSYPGLAPSSGESIRYGSSVAGGATNLYTNAIALPQTITSGSVYYSFIARFNGGVAPGGVRNSYASLSTDTANPLTDAGLGVGTASGTGNIPLPAGAWMRDSGTTDFHFGTGKSNSDGMGPSASAPSWQSTAAGHPFPNQQGNTGGTGQDKATIADDVYFMVIKYTFVDGAANNDIVSLWINPIASTLGDNTGEASASLAGNSYYSAVNATVTANLDASQISSFLLIGRGQASAAGNVNKSLDVTMDELRIGTTWAAVTPVPEASAFAIMAIAVGGALACIRFRQKSRAGSA